ncbi:MAG: hypothetical protein QXQ82_01310 [Candidatus Pacearchaeota archaeon]
MDKTLTMIEKKQKIQELIKAKGPCLPSHLSNEIGLSLLFTSALLSEMVAEKTLKLTFLKIGGSPLYYLEGQEQQLENFIDYLAPQEREAVRLLKEKKVLEDEKLTPLQRVALRNAKDFAKMLKRKIDEKEKIFWHYYLVPEEEVENILNSLKIEEPKETKEEQAEIKVEVKEQEIEPEKLHAEIKVRKREKKKAEAFREKVLESLKKKNIEIFSELKEENKICIALIDSEIGLLKFLVYGINKKVINEADIGLASSYGLEEKLPVLLVTQGKLTKKASEFLKKLGNVILYRI